jgi:hypothetical protein
MKKMIFGVLGALLACQSVQATNELRVSAPVTAAVWNSIAPLETAWANVGEPTLCNWIPSTDAIALGTSFTQTANNCQQAQQKTAQQRQKKAFSDIIRNVGSPIVKTRTLTVNSTQSAVGTYVDPGVWNSIAAAIVSDWGNVGAATGCSNWSPSASTVGVGINFTQTATDCQQPQQQTVQPQEKNSVTNAIRNVGNPVVNSRNTSATQTRTAVGTRLAVDVFTVAISPVYGEYNAPNRTGTLLSSNAPSGTTLLNATPVGSWGELWMTTTPLYSTAAVQSVKWEMMDASMVVRYSVVKTLNTNHPTWLAFNITPDEITKGGTYPNWRLSFTLK